ncbi:MAG TPA: VOC family protein [Terracidiphilus sp.]|jgi:catechol 2,3-dioxygenase-like lactoylglutathione lyase family enzyme
MQFKFLVAASLLAFTVTAAAQMSDKPLKRPRITGISHIAVYTSNPTATEHYYVDIVGAVKGADPESPLGVRYALSATQFIEVLPLPEGAGVNRLDHTAWNTVDAEALRRYLGLRAWKVPGQVEKGSDGSRWFATKDPEGNKVEFVQPPENAKPFAAPNAIGHHIIHVGFLVHNRAVEDTFYRDLLGFRPYWFGGMVEGKIDWVSQQVPDGHDWLEYMMTSGPSGSGIPANISQHSLGVLDHLSIGVDSVEAAHKILQDGNRLGGTHDAHTQIGRDGKGQFNLYDPDGIRLELMNFHASEKPCCSPFTADDPAK